MTKTFGAGERAVAALRGVHLDIPPGRLVMLAGPSGCGKTTLVSITTGMLRPSSGEVEAFGLGWWQLSDDERTRRRGELVGYVFQQFHLIPSLPVLLNVAVPLLARGIPRCAVLARAAGQLEEVGLAGRLDAVPHELSGGMQQRVALARCWLDALVCSFATSRPRTWIPGPARL